MVINIFNGCLPRLQSLHERTLVERNFIIQQKDTKVLELEQELEVVEGELSAAREQAPSRTMKNLVDKLKTQLQVKEKQQKVRIHLIHKYSVMILF